MIKQIILFFLLGISLFAFQLDELKFDKKFKQGKKAEKVFTITNNNDETRKYLLRIENAKSVEVYPKKLVLQKYKSSNFVVKATGKKKGKHSYYLVITDMGSSKKSSKGSSVQIQKNVRIKQEYIVE